MIKQSSLRFIFTFIITMTTDYPALAEGGVTEKKNLSGPFFYSLPIYETKGLFALDDDDNVKLQCDDVIVHWVLHPFARRCRQV